MIRSQAAELERNARGSAASRRASKDALLTRDGDGNHAPCHWCGGTLNFDTIERDRRDAGGSYALANLWSAGRKCNAARGNSGTYKPPARGYCHPITIPFTRNGKRVAR